ncbi:S8 family serine peptidase, partial [Bacteroidales bacterium OttesenSCG-928-I21]|nr:S8 family serine peptidase [Bacteroidales bacterium OttesenSCG-928-I21]
MGFYAGDSLVGNSDIPDFDQLAQAAGITKFSYSLKRIMQALDKNPYSCVDLSFSNKFSVDSLISYFSSQDYIEIAEPYHVYRLASVPTEYNASSNNFWHLRDIDAVGAWNITDSDRQNVIIAVIDNVFDIDHIDLRRNIYVNTGEIPAGTVTDVNGNGVIDADDLFTYYSTRGYSSLRELFTNPPSDEIFNGVDDDGNWYVDDIIGWSVFDASNTVTPAHTRGEYSMHGTHVAGIAGAVSNNGGICALSNNNVRILPIKLSNDLYDYSRLNFDDPLLALEYILSLEEKPNIISMSLSCVNELYLGNILQFLEENYNILSIASTGNDYSDITYTYPANYANVIAVGATDINNRRADFSNCGNFSGTYVMSPGVGIYSSAPLLNFYETHSGTSMSAPLVSALAGLLYSYNPDITPEYARQAIECGCVPIVDYDPALHGSGKINALQTLLCLKSMAPVAQIIELNDFYCPESLSYSSFNGVSLTSSEQCTYQWQISGGAYSLLGSTSDQMLQIRFHEIAIYEIVLTVTNPQGSDTDTIYVETEYPSVSILNGNNIGACHGGNTHVFLRFSGIPPFTINYSFLGITQTISDISEYSYNILLPTNLLEIDASETFRINTISDANCEGTSVQADINVEECGATCGGKYNNLWFLNRRHIGDEYSLGMYFNPEPILVPNPFPAEGSSSEGSASICDYDGNPILAASGGRIYSLKEGCNNEIINSDQLTISPSNYSATQGHLILPNMANPDEYFILCVSQHGDINPKLSFGKIDFSDSICGEYIPIDTFANGEVEKLTACRIDGELGYWIITHRGNTRFLNIYKLSEVDGTLSFEGAEEVIQCDPGFSLGEAKFDLGMNYIAAIYNGNVVELYEFNRRADAVGNRLSFIGSKESQDRVVLYSLDFSPNGNALYIGTEVNSSVLRIPISDFSNSNPPEQVLRITRPEGQTVNISVTLALGPDMKLYVLHYNPLIDLPSFGAACSPGVITNPNSINEPVNFIPAAYNTVGILTFPPRVPMLYADFTLESYISDCSTYIRAVDITDTLPISYRWSTGDVSPEISVSESGTYSLRIAFSNGCVVIREIEIGANELNINVAHSDIHHPCNNQGDGYINLSIAGGTEPFSYIWRDQSGNIIGNSASLTGLDPGTYYLNITDDEGCELDYEQTIYPVSSPLVQVEELLHICEGTARGSAEVVYEGYGNYQYIWSNGETTRVAVDLPGGVNSVTVTNSNGCSTTLSVEIIDVAIDPKFDSNVSCFVVDKPEIYFFPEGVPEDEWHNYDFHWELSDGTTKNNKKIFFFIKNNILAFSFSSKLIEKSIDALENENQSILIEKSFTNLKSTAGKNEMANLYLNVKKTPDLFRNLLNTEAIGEIKNIKNFSDWMELDFNITKDRITLNGFINKSDSISDFVKIIDSQTQIETKCLEILPNTTACYMSFSFNDKDKYDENLTNYLNTISQNETRNERIEKIKKNYDVDIKSIFYPLVEDEISFAVSNIKGNDLFA